MFRFVPGWQMIQSDSHRHFYLATRRARHTRLGWNSAAKSAQQASSPYVLKTRADNKL
jgi:hypothetical protein